MRIARWDKAVIVGNGSLQKHGGRPKTTYAGGDDARCTFYEELATFIRFLARAKAASARSRLIPESPEVRCS